MFRYVMLRYVKICYVMLCYVRLGLCLCLVFITYNCNIGFQFIKRRKVIITHIIV